MGSEFDQLARDCEPNTIDRLIKYARRPHDLSCPDGMAGFLEDLQARKEQLAESKAASLSTRFGMTVPAGVGYSMAPLPPVTAPRGGVFYSHPGWGPRTNGKDRRFRAQLAQLLDVKPVAGFEPSDERAALLEAVQALTEAARVKDSHVSVREATAMKLRELANGLDGAF